MIIDEPLETTITVTTDSLPVFMQQARALIVKMRPSQGANALTVDVEVVCTAQQLYALGVIMGKYEMRQSLEKNQTL